MNNVFLFRVRKLSAKYGKTYQTSAPNPGKVIRKALDFGIAFHEAGLYRDLDIYILVVPYKTIKSG